MFACGQLAAVPPEPGNFCYPACYSHVQCALTRSMAFWSRAFRNKNLLEENLSRASVIRLQLSRSCVGRIGMDLYFDSMKELGHKG